MMKRMLVFMLTACWAMWAGAAHVSADSARRAVSRWAAHKSSAHMRARMDRPVKSVRTVRAEGGDAFHVVDLEGGGFVVAAADDRIEPIVAFADTGTLVEDSKNPLWVLLNLDLPQRIRAHEAGAVTKRDPAKMRGRGRHPHHREAPVEWRELLADDDGAQTATTAAASQSSVSDVRVDALVQSTWNQDACGSGNCYNYYTPNNYVCGCVATAGAQLMRFHEFPTASVTPATFSCWVDDEVTDETMMGGCYDWTSMPLSPSSSTTEAQRQAIGKLCYDVGVASRMDWTSGGSGACPGVLAASFTSVFGYQNAKCHIGSFTTDNMEDSIYANLDAGCPVLLGIHTDDGEGHEIVADGYGLYNDTVYTHLNLGWAGNYNAWYALPSVSAGGYDFSTLSSVVYNVFPDQTGELITGRVLDTNDTPIVGATVTAVNGYTTRTATTDARGIYALHVTSARTWSITVTAEGYARRAASVASGTSKSSTLGTITAGSYNYYTDGSIGNSWGNDITLFAAGSEPPELSGVVVRGPTQMANGVVATFVSMAQYSDGSEKQVSATWSAKSSGKNQYASFSGDVLTASSSRTSDKTVTITATYTENGVTQSGAQTVTIIRRGGTDPRPANDAFASATVLSGMNGAVTGTSAEATDETGEPLMAFDASATGSIWWQWTAPDDGVAVFDTLGSEIDTVLGIYTGTTPAGCTKIAANDNIAEGTNTSACAFACTGGTTYRIAVAGHGGLRGGISLAWKMTNDDFKGAFALTGRSGTTTADNTDATLEDDEPLADFFSTVQRTVWWKWTAPADGEVSFYTEGTSFDTMMGVFVGTTAATAATVAFDDDGGSFRDSCCDFVCTAGTTYYIAVGGYKDACGAITLSWSMDLARPANRFFATAEIVAGAHGSVTGSNTHATLEAGEPLQSAYGWTRRTIWWRWTAPYTGDATFTTVQTGFDTVMGVYTGDALDALDAIAEDDDATLGENMPAACTFACERGVTYHIAVGGSNSRHGDIVLDWSVETEPLPEIVPTDEHADELVREAVQDNPSLASNITDVAAYVDFRAWVEENGVDPETALTSSDSFFSFATDQPGIIDGAQLDAKCVEVCDAIAEDGAVKLTVAIEDVAVGAAAQAQYLEKVFGVTGSATVDGTFAAENVTYRQDLVNNGDGTVSFSAEPKVDAGDAKPARYFFKANINH